MTTRVVISPEFLFNIDSARKLSIVSLSMSLGSRIGSSFRSGLWDVMYAPGSMRRIRVNSPLRNLTGLKLMFVPGLMFLGAAIFTVIRSW